MKRTIVLPLHPLLLEKNIPDEVAVLGWDIEKLLIDCLYWDIDFSITTHEELTNIAQSESGTPLPPHQAKRVYHQYQAIDSWLVALQDWLLSYPVIAKNQYYQNMTARIVHTAHQSFVVIEISPLSYQPSSDDIKHRTFVRC